MSGGHVPRRDKPLPLPPLPKARADGVDRVVQFRALDGTMHDTYAQARKHSSTFALETWLANWLHGENVQHPGTVAQGLAYALRANFNISKRKEK